MRAQGYVNGKESDTLHIDISTVYSLIVNIKRHVGFCLNGASKRQGILLLIYTKTEPLLDW